VDTDTADAHLPGVLFSILIFIEPDPVPDPISFGMENVLAYFASTADDWDFAGEIPIENVQETRCPLSNVELKNPWREPGSRLRARCDWHITDRNQDRRQFEEGRVCHLASCEWVYIAGKVFRFGPIVDGSEVGLGGRCGYWN
jgi:hypothetical protein